MGVSLTMVLLMSVVWVTEVLSRATPAALTSTVEELETVNLMARVKQVPAETTTLISLDRAEAGEGSGDAVVPEWEILKEKLNGAGGGCGVAAAGFGLEGDDGGIGTECAGVVDDGAVDAATEGLGLKERSAEG
jgi:hypothetical protein